MGGVAKIFNTKTKKPYIISTSRDISNYASEVETKLINNWHTNDELQRDYNNNPYAFKIVILHHSNSEEEINYLRDKEIDKYWPEVYNKRRGKVSYEGGNTNPFARKGLNEENEFVMTDSMKDLFDSLNDSNLTTENKDILKEKIENGTIDNIYKLNREKNRLELLRIIDTSELIDKTMLRERVMDGTLNNEVKLKKMIKKQEANDNLFYIINGSDLKPYAKEQLTEEVKNGVISPEDEFKNRMNLRQSSHYSKNKSSNKDKKQYKPPFGICPNCSHPITKENSKYCVKCGYELANYPNKDICPDNGQKSTNHSYYSGNPNSIMAKLFTIEDKNVGNLRYSVSKIAAFMMVIFIIFIYIYLSIFMFNDMFTIMFGIIPMAIVALFYYGLIRVIGFIIRKLR